MSQHYLNIELPEQQNRFLTTWKSPKVEHYFRLVFLVGLVNTGCFIFSFGTGVFSTDVANLQALSYMVLGNFSVSILMRLGCYMRQWQCPHWASVETMEMS